MSVERIWQVRLPDGSAWIPLDSRPDDPRASWIYARSTADTFARDVGGTVVEVTRQQQGKLLDREIAETLAKPPQKSTSRVPSKPRSRRPFGRSVRRVIAAAIPEYVELSGPGRAALETARETADNTEYVDALRRLSAALPATLWVGYDPAKDRGFTQLAEPVWIAEDPQGGEDPAQWRQVARDEIARMLVEDV